MERKESLEYRRENDGNIGSYHNVIPNHKKVYLFAYFSWSDNLREVQVLRHWFKVFEFYPDDKNV